MAYIFTLIDAVVKGNEDSVINTIHLGRDAGIDLVNSSDDNGVTPLMHASASAASELIVPILISEGADITAVDSQGRTALHYHAALGRMFGLSCLLQLYPGSGESVDVHCDDNNSTPLDYAIHFNHHDAIRMLLAFGAKLPEIHENQQKTEP